MALSKYDGARNVVHRTYCDCALEVAARAGHGEWTVGAWTVFMLLGLLAAAVLVALARFVRRHVLAE
ncbi:MAG: hypothetical protein R3E77_10255 [Steroidobacteraceae bacterium]